MEVYGVYTEFYGACRRFYGALAEAGEDLSQRHAGGSKELLRRCFTEVHGGLSGALREEKRR